MLRPPLDERVGALLGDRDAPVRAAVAAWLARLEAWNARIDLTAARHDDELVDLMLADAIELGRHVASDARVVDVGSGAGAPGLALALLRPDLDVTLVEPLQKRVAFLRGAIADAGVGARVRVVRGRGEQARDDGLRADVATSRATLAPDAWLALGLELAPEVWVHLAREAAPEPAAGVERTIFAHAWPRTGAERRTVRYRRPR